MKKFILAILSVALLTLGVNAQITGPSSFRSLSLYDFGMIGNGVDDKVAIAAAITAICASGGELLIPGPVTTTVPIVVPAGCNNVRLRGVSKYGAGASNIAVIYYTGASASPVMTVGTPSAETFQFNVENLYIDGGLHATDGMSMFNVNHSLLKNVSVWSVSSKCWRIAGSVIVNFQNPECSFHSNIGTGFQTPTDGIYTVNAGAGSLNYPAGCFFCDVTNPVIEGLSGVGFNLYDAQGFTINGGTSENNGTGLYCANSSSNLVVNAVDFEGNSVTDLMLTATGPCSMHLNWAR